MTPDCRRTLEGRGMERGIGAPALYEAHAADDKYRQGKSNEEEPKSQVGSRGVPGDDALGGVRRLILLRLQVAHEESGHEESGRSDQHQFQGGEDRSQGSHAELYSTNYFAMQSTSNLGIAATRFPCRGWKEQPQMLPLRVRMTVSAGLDGSWVLQQRTAISERRAGTLRSSQLALSPLATHSTKVLDAALASCS